MDCCEYGFLASDITSTSFLIVSDAYNFNMNSYAIKMYDAINKGILLASGKIISILHSNDTFYDKDTLTSVSKYFEKYDDC